MREAPDALPPPGVLSLYEPRGAPSRARRITPGRGVLSNSLREALLAESRRRRAERIGRDRVMPILDGPEFNEELDQDHDEL